jgi:integrase
MFAATSARLRVVPYRHHPSLRWTLAGYVVNGKRVRRFFRTKGEAETFVQQLRIKVENLGTRASSIDPELHVMALQCSDRLKPFGQSIADATEFYVRHLASIERSCAIEELVTTFIESKRRDGIALRYEQELRSRIGHFVRAFPKRNVATITAIEVDDWLRSLNVAPLSRNNCRRVLHVLFAYAVQRRFCTENPITHTAKAKVTFQPVMVLTPEQTRQLLDAATPEILPVLAVGAFCGLRPAECSRLDWKEVHLDRGFIEVTAKNAKTASRRLVTIQPNLAEWLKPHAKSSGPVYPSGGRKMIETARIRAGFDRWPSNALRHSFASYHLAKFQDAPALALQMGHTTTVMLFAHYREVVTPDDARAYWAIAPSTSPL